MYTFLKLKYSASNFTVLKFIYALYDIFMVLT